VSRLLVSSLRWLGVPAEHASPRELDDDRAPGIATGGAASPCFASTTRHEIVIAGRKLVGSAQRRTAHALLQQGSILLGNGHLALADYLASGPLERATARQRLEQ